MSAYHSPSGFSGDVAGSGGLAGWRRRLRRRAVARIRIGTGFRFCDRIGQPDAAFWLPTSTDRFYPDFVAELQDGRLFVVEYKGGDRWSNDDSREKRDIGQVWAAASNGRCVFAMVTAGAPGGAAAGRARRVTEVIPLKSIWVV
jgi:hypothetical protein